MNFAINEYRGHKCQGYNIDCNFFCNENYIITGSEDSNIFIYDTLSANIIAKYKTHQKCVNLVNYFRYIKIIFHFKISRKSLADKYQNFKI